MVSRKNLILIVIMGILFILPILRYNALNSTIFDLGVFQHQVYNLSIYGFGFGHFQVFQPFYHMFYSEYFLIISQSFLVLSPIYFIYKLGNEQKTFLVTIYLLCYAVWYNVLFDFHFDHISILFMMMFYYFIREGKYKSAFFISIMVSLIKEPFALVTSFMGLYLIIKSRQYIKGSILFVYGFVYFYLTINYIIPSFTPEYIQVGSDTFSSFGNGGGLLNIMLYPITHFQEFIIEIITTKKLIYLIALFSAFGLVIVFFSPLELIPAIPPLAIALLSNVENHYWYNTHYTAPLIAPFMVAFIFGLPKLILFCKRKIKYLNTTKKILIVVFIPVIFSHILFSPSPISRFFWINKLPQYHHTTYISTERTQKIKEAILKYIPSDEKISIASQNSLHWEYLSRREYFFSFPQGVLTETNINYTTSNNFIDIFNHITGEDTSIIHTKKIKVDFIIIDMKRPFYLIDKYANRIEFTNKIEKMQIDYSIIYKYDDFYIFKLNK